VRGGAPGRGTAVARDGTPWLDAAASIDVPREAYRIGAVTDDVELVEIDRTLTETYELATGGAVLIRPDGYVARRADTAVDDSQNSLRSALEQVLG
jgi:putative polyketide hydroxylase